ncbi:MAG TPA: hypothetical protein VE008_01270 [Burkholderiales bacterium]|nr:hypothetical protein [Burkholderiales bacterium]
MSSALGIAGCVLLCLAVLAWALRLEKRAVRVRSAILAAAAVLLLAPLGGLPVAAYVRGAIGDPSAATLALAAGALFFRLTGRAAIEPGEARALLWAVVAAALFLYPFALGWTPYDPYALGYASPVFITVLLAATLAAWRAGLKLAVLVVLVGGLAYLAGAYESRNLWDYLIDPLAAIYALGALLAAGARTLVSQRRQRAPVV